MGIEKRIDKDNRPTLLDICKKYGVQLNEENNWRIVFRKDEKIAFIKLMPGQNAGLYKGTSRILVCTPKGDRREEDANFIKLHDTPELAFPVYMHHHTKMNELGKFYYIETLISDDVCKAMHWLFEHDLGGKPFEVQLLQKYENQVPLKKVNAEELGIDIDKLEELRKKLK